MPKVIHVPYCYYPDPVGGTEIYVEALARELARFGFDSIVAAPGAMATAYDHAGVRVYRLTTSEHPNLRELYGDGDPQAADQFGQVLDREQPSLVHLHAFTSGASLLLVREAAQRGVPVVFTYHTPTVTCLRGTLLRFGEQQCDGTLDLHECAACALQGRGAPGPIARTLGRLPASTARALGNTGFAGSVWTAVRMTEFTGLRHAAFRNLAAEADEIVAPCHWVRDLLVRNQVPAEKITLCRQGLAQTNPAVPPPTHDDSQLRMAFLGRLDPTKGLHVLLQSLREIPQASCRLDAYVVRAADGDAAYYKKIEQLATADPRVTLHQSVPSAEVVDRLRDYDVLAVPSQWMETGPLVVLEAFAAGIPILGSRLGGIAELIADGVNGILVQPDSLGDWAAAISRLCSHREELRALRSGIPAPRLMSDVASDMSHLYSRLISARAQAAVPCGAI